MHILHTLLYISWGADKKNLFANQKVLSLVIISFILMTLMCDSGVMLWGEIRCWSLLGVKSWYRVEHFGRMSEHICENIKTVEWPK